jgi:hypothetical protein
MSYKICGCVVIDNSRNICVNNVTSCCIEATTELVVPYGTTACRPANDVGLLYYDTDEGSLVVNNGSEWASAGGASGIKPNNINSTSNAAFGIYSVYVEQCDGYPICCWNCDTGFFNTAYQCQYNIERGDTAGCSCACLYTKDYARTTAAQGITRFGKGGFFPCTSQCCTNVSFSNGHVCCFYTSDYRPHIMPDGGALFWQSDCPSAVIFCNVCAACECKWRNVYINGFGGITEIDTPVNARCIFCTTYKPRVGEFYFPTHAGHTPYGPRALIQGSIACLLDLCCCNYANQVASYTVKQKVAGTDSLQVCDFAYLGLCNNAQDGSCETYTPAGFLCCCQFCIPGATYRQSRESFQIIPNCPTLPDVYNPDCYACLMCTMGDGTECRKIAAENCLVAVSTNKYFFNEGQNCCPSRNFGDWDYCGTKWFSKDCCYLYSLSGMQSTQKNACTFACDWNAACAGQNICYGGSNLILTVYDRINACIKSVITWCCWDDEDHPKRCAFDGGPYAYCGYCCNACVASRPWTCSAGLNHYQKCSIYLGSRNLLTAEGQGAWSCNSNKYYSLSKSNHAVNNESVLGVFDADTCKIVCSFCINQILNNGCVRKNLAAMNKPSCCTDITPCNTAGYSSWLTTNYPTGTYGNWTMSRHILGRNLGTGGWPGSSLACPRFIEGGSYCITGSGYGEMYTYVNPTNDHLVMLRGLASCNTTNSCGYNGGMAWYGVICFDLENQCITKVNTLWPTSDYIDGLFTRDVWDSATYCATSRACCGGWAVLNSNAMCKVGLGPLCCSTTNPGRRPATVHNYCVHNSTDEGGAVVILHPDMMCGLSCAFRSSCVTYNCSEHDPFGCCCYGVCKSGNTLCRNGTNFGLCLDPKFAYYKIPHSTPYECAGWENDLKMKCYIETAMGLTDLSCVIDCLDTVQCQNYLAHVTRGEWYIPGYKYISGECLASQPGLCCDRLFGITSTCVKTNAYCILKASDTTAVCVCGAGYGGWINAPFCDIVNNCGFNWNTNSYKIYTNAGSNHFGGEKDLHNNLGSTWTYAYSATDGYKYRKSLGGDTTFQLEPGESVYSGLCKWVKESYFCICECS